MKKKCIFHIPNYIDQDGRSGSQVRPKKMMQAFKDLGYDVDIVMGYGIDRKKSIELIKEKIKNGEKYDFLYGESSSEPTILTEKNHMPRYPFLDFGFYRYCKRNGIKIALFYRDAYWRFPVYKDNVKGIKYFVAQLAYRYDLNMYCKLLDIFYVPNRRMGKYIKRGKLESIMRELPPGCDCDEMILEKKKKYFSKRLQENSKDLTLFYVGGIGNHYVIDELLKGIKNRDNIELTICCREKEWEDNKRILEQNLTPRVHIIHKSGIELLEHYLSTDICMCYFEGDEYMEMAVPVKLFEYLSYGIPIIASTGNPAGDFVEQNGIGWSIPYDAEGVQKLLLELSNDYQQIYDRHLCCLEVLRRNRWIDRAEKVREELK